MVQFGGLSSVLITVVLLLCGAADAEVELLASSVQEVIPANCRVSDSATVAQMPQPRSAESKDINFCHAFTAALLLDQLNCRVGLANCSMAKDQVAILDMALRGDGDRLDDIGSELYDLLGAESTGKVALESCQPFQAFPFLRSSNPSRQEIWAQLMLSYMGSQDNLNRQVHQPNCSEENVVHLRQIANLKVANDKIVESLNETDFNKFIGDLVVSPACRKRGAAVPPFYLSAFPFDGNVNSYDDLDRKLSASFNRNTPVTWSFCLAQKDGFCAAGHIVALFGSRRLCCEGGGGQNCEIQYHTRDSGRYVGSNPGDYWIDQDAFRRKTTEYIKTSPPSPMNRLALEFATVVPVNQSHPMPSSFLIGHTSKDE